MLVFHTSKRTAQPSTNSSETTCMGIRCWLVVLPCLGGLVRCADAAEPAPDDGWQPTAQWYRIEVPVWRVAPRHKPFFSRLPSDFRVQQLADRTTLQKVAGLGRPVYHACPGVPLRVGQRMRIVYSLTRRGRSGGTPVPYFGVRDDQGLERVLFLFGSFPKADEVHEIVVERLRDGFRAKRGQRVVEEPAVDRNSGNLADPLFVFFHMNDTSEVVIHEVATSEPPETEPAPERADVVQSRCEAPQRRCRAKGLINLRLRFRRR